MVLLKNTPELIVSRAERNELEGNGYDVDSARKEISDAEHELSVQEIASLI
jgi:hypothetical protein